MTNIEDVFLIILYRHCKSCERTCHTDRCHSIYDMMREDVSEREREKQQVSVSNHKLLSNKRKRKLSSEMIWSGTLWFCFQLFPFPSSPFLTLPFRCRCCSAGCWLIICFHFFFKKKLNCLTLRIISLFCSNKNVKKAWQVNGYGEKVHHREWAFAKLRYYQI